MRVLLAPHGTRGDVQPMLALAVGLRARGHDVSFVAPVNSVAWITSFGFPCVSDGIDVEQLMQGAGMRLQSLRWQMRYLTDTLIRSCSKPYSRRPKPPPRRSSWDPACRWPALRSLNCVESHRRAQCLRL